MTGLAETSLTPVIAEGAWAPGPLRPSLDCGAVHVWRADLSAVSEDLGELLCGEERARAERFLGERDRQPWMRSRGVLRALLGRYLRRDPSSLRFTAGPHGKPALVQDTHEAPAAAELSAARSSRPCFNMSHSGQLALYAFSQTRAVGVDVEVAREPGNEVAIAGRIFGAGVARRLERLDPGARQREFLRAWVRHEAELKCTGVGIGRAKAGVDARSPWVAELDVGSGAAAAVAAESPARELRCWDWLAAPT